MGRETKDNVIARCTGLNYTVSVTGNNLLVTRRFTLGESLMTIPHENVKVLELRTKSVVPALFTGVLTLVATLAIWAFLGAWGNPTRLRIPPTTLVEVWPYLFFATVILGVYLLLAAYWRLKVGTLIIGLVGDLHPITVRLVSTARARRILSSLGPRAAVP